MEFLFIEPSKPARAPDIPPARLLSVAEVTCRTAVDVSFGDLRLTTINLPITSRGDASAADASADTVSRDWTFMMNV